MSRSRARPVALWQRLVPWVALVGGIALLVFLLQNFVAGRYLPGKGGRREAREAWEAYGAGAFAADSAIYLWFAFVVLAMLAVTVVIMLGERAKRWRDRIPGIAISIIGLGSIVTLALLVVYGVSGVPFRNFQPMNADALLYSVTCLIPLVGLLGVGLFAAQWWRRGIGAKSTAFAVRERDD